MSLVPLRRLPPSCRRLAHRYNSTASSPAATRAPAKKNNGLSFHKYAYYDAVVDIADLNIVRTDAYYIARQRKRFESKDDDAVLPPKPTTAPAPTLSATSPKSYVFDPSAKASGPSFDQVFGGSSKTATQSSRRDLSYRDKNKLIGGIRVPARPIEPDNCCMSGCVNCVWELFNEDLEEWKHKRVEAAHRLMAQKDKGPLGANGKLEVWPHDWELPPKILDSQFISSDFKAKVAKHKAAGGADLDEIQGMPVGLQVFAMFEKKKKEQRQKKLEQKKKLEQSANTNASIEQSISSSKPSSTTSATL